MKLCSRSDSSTSMTIDSCSVKLKIFALVVNTAELINDRTTTTLTMTTAVIAPIAIFITYVSMGSFLIAAIRNQSASIFQQCYLLVACISLQATLSILVFRALTVDIGMKKHTELLLNAVLPMLIIPLLLSDLVIILLSSRDEILAQISESLHSSFMDSNTI